jgi:hypothetical protein
VIAAMVGWLIGREIGRRIGQSYGQDRADEIAWRIASSENLLLNSRFSTASTGEWGVK